MGCHTFPRDNKARKTAKRLDLENLYRELSIRHTELVQPPRDMPYVEEFYVADPNGYIFAFLTEA